MSRIMGSARSPYFAVTRPVERWSLHDPGRLGRHRVLGYPFRSLLPLKAVKLLDHRQPDLPAHVILLEVDEQLRQAECGS